jgi:hypothetical protein
METILYIALFSILIGGATIAVYSLSEGAEKNDVQAILLEEGHFLLRKVGTIIKHSQAIISPAENSTYPSFSAMADGVPILIESSEDRILIKIPGGTEPLTGNLVHANNLTFSRVTDATGDTVTFQFTLSTLTPQGSSVSQIFSETYTNDK